MTKSRVEAAKEPFVSIIVPSFRRPDVLRLTLRALLRLDYPEDKHEIIVVDDGSGDETPEVVRAEQQGCERLRYCVQPNSGVATARNRGARMARGENLIFIDDDIIVEPDFITHHLRVMSEFDNCFVNGRWEFTPELKAALEKTSFGRFRIKVEEWVKQGEAKVPLYGSYVETTSVTAQNLGVRADDYWRVNGFDEQFPYAGREDEEFSIRAAAARIRFVRDLSMEVLQNDHRLTLKQFCERKRRDAVTVVVLTAKYPERWQNYSMLHENLPPRRTDAPKVFIKKIIKEILSREIPLGGVCWIITLLERVGASDRLLHRLYWATCGLYIYAGIRQGLRQHDVTRLATTHRETTAFNENRV